MKTIVAAGAMALALATQAHAACSEDIVRIVGDFGQANFNITVADEPAEWQQGLMFVEEMPTLSGMLFVYDTPRRASFWMRNTLIPLDMLFVDATGTITRIHEEAIPLDETPIDGGNDVLAVLEINGGMAGRLGIAEGDAIQHPSFGDDSVLPCAN